MRKCNQNRHTLKSKTAANAILKISFFVITRVFMVRLCSNFYHSIVLSSSVRKYHRKRNKRKHKMAAAAILKINYTF
jgi:hypothetical protein